VLVDLFPTSRLVHGNARTIRLVDVFDRSLLVFACPPFKLPYLAARLCPSPTTLLFYFYFLFHLVVPRFFKPVTLTSIPLALPATEPS
jgi:hypothetical protein